MGCTRICTDSCGHGNSLEDKPAKADSLGGRHSPMSLDLYSVVGLAAMALVTTVVILRLIRDESSLRRKRILTDKY